MNRPPLHPKHKAALEGREAAIKGGLDHLFEFWESRTGSNANRCLIDAKVRMKAYSQSKDKSFTNAVNLQKADYYFYRAYTNLGLAIQGEEMILEKLCEIITDLRNALGFIRACLNWCSPYAKGQGYRFPVIEEDITLFQPIDTFIDVLTSMYSLSSSNNPQL